MTSRTTFGQIEAADSVSSPEEKVHGLQEVVDVPVRFDEGVGLIGRPAVKIEID